jgi:hypothetical protein
MRTNGFVNDNEMKIKLSNDDIGRYLDIETPEFPKYTTQLINLANQNAQGTRPRVVGQMSELIQHFTGRTLDEWEQWYLKEKPGAIQSATEKVLQMTGNLRGAMDQIDRKMIQTWVHDLVIVKTFMGLRFHEAILKKGAELKGGVAWRLADETEESKGIDGYIGDVPVSIKPETYKVKSSLQEEVSGRMVYYRKVKNGLEVDYGQLIGQ